MARNFLFNTFDFYSHILLVRILSSTEGLICPDFVLTQTEQFQNDDKTANGNCPCGKSS